MNILLIGNGFDLAHELPTKYTDFLDFVDVVKLLISSKKKTDLNNVHSNKIYFNKLNKLNYTIRYRVNYYFEKDKFANNPIDLWDKIITDNIWIEYFSKNESNMKENWIDFEKEIYFVISELEKEIKEKPFSIYSIWGNNYKNDNSKRDLSIISKTYKQKLGEANELLEKNLNLFIKELENDLEKLIFALELYINNFVNTINIKSYSPDIKHLKIDKIISFNYSNTYERIYDQTDWPLSKYDYIHGKADNHSDYEENNLVLGINEYLKGDEKNENIRFIRFKKFFQRIHKETGCIYKSWIEQINQSSRLDEHNLYIFGHSLDDTDKDILNELILNDKITTTIFYHNREAYAQQITNLVKVIGQDELIRKTGGAHKTIIFKEQSLMTNSPPNK